MKKNFDVFSLILHLEKRCCGSNISSTESNVNIRMSKAWTAIDC